MQQKDFYHNPSDYKIHSSFFLLGLPGSGKSFWADKLSHLLTVPAFHLDNEIEMSEQKTIAQIFSEKGEDYFRHKETEILKTFSNRTSFVLSVGGGTPCFNNNMEWMNANGITVWIDESIEVIEQRLMQGKTHRPLIANIPDEKLHSFLSEISKKRTAFYSEAKHHLKEDNINEASFLKILTMYE